jgi:hypothetical protein
MSNVKVENTITIIEVENHLYTWFGHDWNNQSSTQILAMAISLLAKVNVEVVSEEEPIEEYNGDESDKFLQ